LEFDTENELDDRAFLDVVVNDRNDKDDRATQRRHLGEYAKL
jgi:hypothetical protein